MSYVEYGYSHEESTPRYLPTECLLSSKFIPYTKASDIWSLGAILEYIVGVIRSLIAEDRQV